MTTTFYNALNNNPNKDEIIRCKILIVEDDFIARETIKRIFSSQGFTNVIDAENGRDGIEKLRAEKPSLVISDVQMPVMDGLEMCRAIRAEADRDLAAVPILVQTGMDRASGVFMKIYESGASDYLSKPIDPVELLTRSVLHLEFAVLAKIIKRFKENK